MKNEFIRLARFHLGDLTQQQLADLLGTSKMHINLVENGKRDAKITLILAIECLLRRAEKWPIN